MIDLKKRVYSQNYGPEVLSLPPNKFGGPLPFTRPWAATVLENIPSCSFKIEKSICGVGQNFSTAFFSLEKF